MAAAPGHASDSAVRDGGSGAQKGMKLDALLKLGNCVICGKKQLEGALPLFYCVTISRAGFNKDALRRAAGFEMMMGPIAQVMGANEDLATVIDGPHAVFVHELCADKIAHLIQLIPEASAAALNAHGTETCAIEASKPI